MQKNVGRTDAMIRITGGLLGLAYGIGKMSRRPYNTPWLLMGLSAMKVAEGATRFCPMYAALGINSRKQNGMQTIMDKAKGKGMLTMMKQVTGAMGFSDPKSQAGSKAAAQKTEAKYTAEDKQLETAVEEFVSSRSKDKESHSKPEKRQSDTYDEHRYPTYS